MKLLNRYTAPDSGALRTIPNNPGAAATGYVPQDDIISRELGLRDALILSAALRYSPGTDRSVIEERTDEVMGELGLTENGESLGGTALRRPARTGFGCSSS